MFAVPSPLLPDWAFVLLNAKKIRQRETGFFSLCRVSDTSSADRTVIIVLIRFKAASHALFMTLSRTFLPGSCIPSFLYQTKIRLCNIRIFSSENGLSHLRLQFINRLAAVHFHIVAPIPFKKRNEEKAEIRINH